MHVRINCPNPKADAGKLAHLHKLVLLYVHSKKMENHDKALSEISTKKPRTEEAASGSTEIDDPEGAPPNDGLRTITSDSKPFCINCLREGHLVENCDSTTVSS